MDIILKNLLDWVLRLLPTEQVVKHFLNLLAERLATEEVKNAILALVKEVMSFELDGEEKKTVVKSRLQQLQGEVGKSVAMTANWVIDTLIQTAFLSLVAGERSIFKKQDK
jgi:asparagine synthetase A